MTVLNFNNLYLAIEIGASFGMLILTVGALIYVSMKKERVQSWTNIMVFITLIISFICQAALSILDLKNRKSMSEGEKSTADFLYAG